MHLIRHNSRQVLNTYILTYVVSVLFFVSYFLIARLMFLIFFVCLFACFVYLFFMLYILCFLYCFVYFSSSLYSCLFTIFCTSIATTATGWKPSCSKYVSYQIIFLYQNASINEYLAFRGPCMVIYSYNKSRRDALFLNFILVNNSTCFGKIYCPPSGDVILYSQQLVFVILVTLTVC